MRERVIIIGAGINGLVTANYLSRAGFGVLQLEIKDQVGGVWLLEDDHLQSQVLGKKLLGTSGKSAEIFY